MTIYHLTNALFKKIILVLFFTIILNNITAYAQGGNGVFIERLDGVPVNYDAINNKYYTNVDQGSTIAFRLLDNTSIISSVLGWDMLPPNPANGVVPRGPDLFITDVHFGATGTYDLYAVYQTFSNTYTQHIDVIVNSALSPGSISGTQTICSLGDPSVLSNTALASNGNGSYSYQWQYSNTGTSGWTNISGVTTTSYDPPSGELTANRWYRRKVTSDGNTAYTSSVKVTVSPAISSAGSINGAATICGNDPGLLGSTSLPSGGNGSYTYQWQYSNNNSTWNNITGATSTTYNPPAGLTSDRWYRRGATSCGQTLYTAPVLISVFQTSLNVSDGQNSCSSSNITLSAYSIDAPSGAIHKWYTTETGNSTVVPEPTVISSVPLHTQVTVSAQTKSYWVSVFYNGCESARQEVTATYTPNTTPTLTLFSPNNEGQCGPTATFNLYATGGSSGSTYQWYDAASGGTLLHTGENYSPTLNYGDLSGGQKTYYVGGTMKNALGCSFNISPRKAITVTIHPGLNSAGNINGAATICGNDPGLLGSTSLPSGGNGSYAYQWQYSDNNSSWNDIAGATSTTYNPPSGLTNDRWYRRGAISCGQTLYSNTVKVTLYETSLNVSDGQNSCSSSNITLSAYSISAPEGTVHKWYTTSTGSTTVTPTVLNTSFPLQTQVIVSAQTKSYWVSEVYNGCESARQEVTATYTPNTTPTLTLFSPNNEGQCGPTATFNLYATGGSSGSTYQWYDAASGGTLLHTGENYSPTLNYGDLSGGQKTYYVGGTMKNALGCSFNISPRKAITVTIHPGLNSAGNINGAATICGNDPGLLGSTSLPSGGDGSYTYQWQYSDNNSSWNDIAGATSTTYNPPSGLTNDRWYRRGAISCGQTLYSNTVKVTLYETSLNVSDGQNSCSSSNITLSAYSISAPEGTVHKWYTTSTGSTTVTPTVLNTSFPLQTQVIVSAQTKSYWVSEVYNGCESARQEVTATYTPNTTPAIAFGPAPDQCGASASFSLLVGGGEAGSTYQWYDALTGGSLLYTGQNYITPTLNYADLVNGQKTYYVGGTLINSLGCSYTISPRKAITVTINPLPETPVNGNGDSICNSGSVTVSASPGDNGDTVRWYTAASGGTYLGEGNSYTTTISTTTTFYAETYAPGCVSSNRLPVTATVNPIPGTPVGGTGDNICSPGSITVSAAPGTNGSTVRWYTAASGGTYLGEGNSYTTTISTTTTFYAETYTSGCVSSSRLPVTATLSPTPGIPVDGNGDSVCGPGSITVSASPGNNGNTVRWYTAASGGTYLGEGNSYTTTISTSTTFYAETYTSGCTSSSRLPVIATVHPALIAGSVAGDQTIPYNGDPSTLTSVTDASGGDGNYSYQWQFSDDGLSGWTDISNATLESYDPPAGLLADRWYRRNVTSCNNSLGTDSVKVTVTGNTAPPATITFCTSALGYEPTVADLSPGNSNINWYANETDTTPLASDFNLYGESDGTGVDYWWDDVTDANPDKTKSTVIIDGGVPIAEDFQVFGIGEDARVSDLVVTGTNIQWFSTPTGGTPYNTTDVLASDNLYYVEDVGTSTCRLFVEVFVGTRKPDGDGVQYFCDGQTVGNIVVNVDNGETVKWYDSDTGGNELNDLSTALVDNQTYYASRIDVDGYESEERLSVLVNIRVVEPPIIPSDPQEFHSNAPQKVANLLAFGSNIEWFSQATGGFELGDDVGLQHANQYYAQQTVNGCTSERVAVTVSILPDEIPTIISCEKFKPLLGGHYVISGWVKEQAVEAENSLIIPFNSSEASGLFVDLLNHLKDRIRSVPEGDEFPTEIHIPPVYVPQVDGKNFDLIMRYVKYLETGENVLTVYNFKREKDTYGRTVGFSFSLHKAAINPDDNDNLPPPVFVWKSPKISGTNDHYPILNNNDNLDINFTNVSVSGTTLNINSSFVFDNTDLSEAYPNTVSGLESSITYSDFKEATNSTPSITYSNAFIEIEYLDASDSVLETKRFNPSGTIIDGWQRISGDFTIPIDVNDINVNTMKIKLFNNNTTALTHTFFDDVRVHPFDSNMKTFVYHPENQRLMSELDENNYATFYEYDLEGGLVRVKKETEKGVYTIQETRSGNVKN